MSSKALKYVHLPRGNRRKKVSSAPLFASSTNRLDMHKESRVAREMKRWISLLSVLNSTRTHGEKNERKTIRSLPDKQSEGNGLRNGRGFRRKETICTDPGRKTFYSLQQRERNKEQKDWSEGAVAPKHTTLSIPTPCVLVTLSRPLDQVAREKNVSSKPWEVGRGEQEEKDTRKEMNQSQTKKKPLTSRSSHEGYAQQSRAQSPTRRPFWQDPRPPSLSSRPRPSSTWPLRFCSRPCPTPPQHGPIWS